MALAQAEDERVADDESEPDAEPHTVCDNVGTPETDGLPLGLGLGDGERLDAPERLGELDVLGEPLVDALSRLLRVPLGEALNVGGTLREADVEADAVPLLSLLELALDDALNEPSAVGVAGSVRVSVAAPEADGESSGD